ncbi:MAG: copper transporter [Acidimicrobiales bacterium]
MINLRYHIVSITAVFLALGIGLTLGSTFLDRVTVDTLKNQLDTVQGRVDDTEAENAVLRDRITALDGREDDLALELPERLLEERLAGVPVLVLATRGTDETLVDGAVTALSSADAAVAGTWWLTDRWLLDDPEEIDQLSEILELRTDDVDRLRRNGAIRLAELLETAGEPLVPFAPTDPAATDADTVDGALAEEPVLVAALEDAGFIDYAAPSGSTDDRVLLPAAGLRYVVASGAEPGSGPQLMAAALLEEMAAEGPAPVVAAQGETDLPDDEDGTPASEDERRTSFVGPIREGELTQDRVSTVDSLDMASGVAALVLAVEDLAADRVGHYGVAPGASRLLPGTDPDT